LQKVQALEGEAVEVGLILDEFVFRLVNSREGKGQEAQHDVAVQAPRFTILMVKCSASVIVLVCFGGSKGKETCNCS
jgi:hypothetical protein